MLGSELYQESVESIKRKHPVDINIIIMLTCNIWAISVVLIRANSLDPMNVVRTRCEVGKPNEHFRTELWILNAEQDEHFAVLRGRFSPKIQAASSPWYNEQLSARHLYQIRYQQGRRRSAYPLLDCDDVTEDESPDPKLLGPSADSHKNISKQKSFEEDEHFKMETQNTTNREDHDSDVESENEIDAEDVYFSNEYEQSAAEAIDFATRDAQSLEMESIDTYGAEIAEDTLLDAEDIYFANH